PSFPNWIVRDGFNLTLAATVLPALLLAPAVWWLMRRTTAAAHRAMLALALGPVLVALAMATIELRWWNLVDGTLLLLLLALAVTAQAQLKPLASRALAFTAVVATFVPGIVLFARQVSPAVRDAVGAGDISSLLERDLACWLANRV